MVAAPLWFDGAAVAAALSPAELIAALREAFVLGGEAPVRHHHAIRHSDGSAATLLLMPAWRVDDVTGVKLVHICPGNEARGLPSVQGVYLLFDGPTGTPRAVLDGTALTVRRTAAASALAADMLARADARHLLMVGAGALAPHLIAAHCTVRPIDRVSIWNRSHGRAERLAEELQIAKVRAVAVMELEQAVREADVVSCATMSETPLVLGAWLRPGTHLDLVGAYRPEMRETDDEVLRRATVFVDTRDGALSEAGDILQAIRSGAFRASDIAADLFELCPDRHPGRRRADEITVFKSCGSALEDLAAARLVVAKQSTGQPSA